MFRRLFTFIFQLIVLAVVLVGMTIIWSLLEGLTDAQNHAEVALIASHTEDEAAPSWALLQIKLDRAVKLYTDGQVHDFIVSGGVPTTGYDETARMSQYLQSKGVPAMAITEDNRTLERHALAGRWAYLIREHQPASASIVDDYYRITGLKLALKLNGIAHVDHVHVGQLQKSDAMPIAQEAVSFYTYLSKYYLMPNAEKWTKVAREEATTGMEKARDEAGKAKESVDKKIDKLDK